MHIFFPSRETPEGFILEDEELKHLKVRRVRPGDTLGLIWKESLYKAKLIRVDKNVALCEPVKTLPTVKPEVEVTLYQCVTQELKTMDTIVRKATELGAKSLYPVISSRSFRNLEAIEKRFSRWKKIVRESMKQSGRAYPLEIGPVLNLQELKAEMDANLILDNFYEGAYISEVTKNRVGSVSILVGPEGGFSEEEGKALRERGFISVRLKPFTLRTETATEVAIGIIVNFVRP